MTMRSLSAIAGYVQGFRCRSIVIATLAAVAVQVGGTRGAHAGYEITGGSSGSLISANVTAGSLLGTTAILDSLANTAPGAYNTTSPLVTASVGIIGLFSATAATTVSTTSISSNIGVGSTTGMTNGSTTINNLNLVLLNLVTITAATLTTNSTASGTATGANGSLTASAAAGTPGITGLGFSVGGADVTAVVDAVLQTGAIVDVTQALGISPLVADIKIGLDVTTTFGNGSTMAGITSDNLIIQVTTLGIGATIDVGQSSAYVSAVSVPEPASIAMMGLGLAGVFAFGRKVKGRKPQTPAVA
jgi:hypothetical protein